MTAPSSPPPRAVTVTEAVLGRRATRAYLDRPVPRALVEEILALARRAPSGGNLQPWRVWALAGADLAALCDRARLAILAQPQGEDVEYRIYPSNLKEPYRTRRYRNGEDLYAALGIPRDDKLARLAQMARNFAFFGAPVGLFFAIDRDMQQGQWADLGMFIQTITLLAVERGLATCPQESWSLVHRTVAAHIDMPPELMLFCGMAMGYPDPTHPINQFPTDRAPLDEIAVLRGFPEG